MNLKAGVLIGVFGIAAVGTLGGSGIYQAVTKEEIQFTVTDKERVQDAESSKYLVFTKDDQDEVEVFENVDSMWQWKFNSSTVQGQLEEGNSYKAEVTGIRIPLFSVYRNVVEVEKIPNLSENVETAPQKVTSSANKM